MSEIIIIMQQIEAAQVALIKALDTQDASAIQAAVSALEPLMDELQRSNAIYANVDTKKRFENLRNMADAAMYRVNILHDQTRRRLEMLHDQRSQAGDIYARPVARIIEA